MRTRGCGIAARATARRGILVLAGPASNVRPREVLSTLSETPKSLPRIGLYGEAVITEQENHQDAHNDQPHPDRARRAALRRDTHSDLLGRHVLEHDVTSRVCQP